jgi:two-component system response regulator BaeR
LSRTILIVEDEPKLASLIADYLAQASFNTHIISNGLDVAPWLTEHTCDLMILDLMLPGKDGLTVCRETRQSSNIPIMMATAKVEEIDRLIGLESGADDYICKPFSYRELVARIQAFFRRQTQYTSAHNKTIENPTAPSSFPQNLAPVTSALSLDNEKYLAHFRGKQLNLTAVEYKLLATLATEPGRIFNREQLMSLIYQEYKVVSDRTIDSHIKKLRQKLRHVAGDQTLIHSVYSVGYKYEY